jgi:hypothetical protein
MKENTKPMKIWFLWVLATTAGWTVARYVGIALWKVVLTSWTQVPALVFALAWNGLLLGGVVGLLQWFVLRIWNQEKGWWVLATIASYSLGSPLALLLILVLDVILARVNHFSLFVPGTSVSLSMPLPLTMILTGALIAIGQWPVLHQFIPALKTKEAVLWIVGTAFAWGIALWGVSYALTIGFSLLVQNAVAGGIIGIETGAILALLLSQPIQPARLESTQASN